MPTDHATIDASTDLNESGPALDAAVAAEFLLWTHAPGESRSWRGWRRPDGTYVHQLPPWSADLSLAWSLLDRAAADGWDVAFTRAFGEDEWELLAIFPPQKPWRAVRVRHASASVAICMALRAMRGAEADPGGRIGS